MTDNEVIVRLLIEEIMNKENFIIKPAIALKNKMYFETAIKVLFNTNSTKYEFIILLDDISEDMINEDENVKAQYEDGVKIYSEFTLNKVSKDSITNVFTLAFVDRSMNGVAKKCILNLKQIGFRHTDKFDKYLDDEVVKILKALDN